MSNPAGNKYGSFNEMVVGEGQITTPTPLRENVWNDGRVQTDAPTENYYGQGTGIGISIHSDQIPDEFGTRSVEKIAHHVAKCIGMHITKHDSDGNFLTAYNAAIDSRSGILSVEGKEVGTLLSPAEVIVTALNQNNLYRNSIPETIEKSIWEFVDRNRDKFQ